MKFYAIRMRDWVQIRRARVAPKLKVSTTKLKVKTRCGVHFLANGGYREDIKKDILEFKTQIYDGGREFITMRRSSFAIQICPRRMADNQMLPLNAQETKNLLAYKERLEK